MPQTYDGGSLPFVGDLDKFSSGADSYGSDQQKDSQRYFEERVVSALEDKIRAGMNIPCFPQFQDMNKVVDLILSGKAIIPEVAAIKNRSEEIYEKIGKPVRLKICITGPYTLANDFKSYSLLTEEFGSKYYEKMADELSKIVRANVSKGKHFNIELVTLDDPVIGLIDDSRLDYGGPDRERLIRSLEGILHTAKSMGAKTSLHLHNTSNRLIWELESLDIIESHIDDPIHNKPDRETISHIKDDKVLKASVCITDFDKLIRRKLMEDSENDPNPITSENDSRLGEMIANEWKRFKHDPPRSLMFLESVETMRRRLLKTIDIYGEDRVPYAGPECGLKSFPSYNAAVEYLRRAAEASRI